MKIFNNTVDIDNDGPLSIAGGRRRWRLGGFSLSGLENNNNNEKPPLFKVAGNNIKVTHSVFNIESRVAVDLACNNLTGERPWFQARRQYPLIAIEPSKQQAQCGGTLTNIWKPRRDNPSARANDSLINVENRFLFTTVPPDPVFPDDCPACPTAPACPSTPRPTVLCDFLTGQSMGVQKKLDQYKDLFSGRQCVVLSADPAQDLSALIKRTPPNAVVLLSSETVSGPSATSSGSSATSSVPSTTSVTGKTPVEYFTDHEISLKDGQAIIGAADDDSEIVIRDRPGFKHHHLIRVGAKDDFQLSDTRDSHIKHITFRPARNDGHHPIDSIVFAECYNRKLMVEDNLFHGPARAAVTLNCAKFLDASAANWIQGPNLRFANNRIIGEKYDSMVDQRVPHDILNQGLFIHLPAIVKQSGQLSVISNTFEGNMDHAGVLRLATGSYIRVRENLIDISNVGSASGDSIDKGGFVLSGPVKDTVVPAVFYLAGNQIRATQTAIAVKGELALALVCNHLQGTRAWHQPQQQFSMKALSKMPKDVSNVCRNLVSSTALPTTPPSGNRLANTWTAINDSLETPCCGLTNFEGQFVFDTEVCQPGTVTCLTDTDATAAPTSSSAGTTAVTTALGIITTLSILQAL
ncbi:hypothetical protein [Endozoicomonas sp. 4G]|uniref:hypothetical protein n=1 Tax=Endozoicomonas sp. 4G TaxID=2872754 RepID=UPI0020784FCD|nr:hypothetical protein [Endozoicomonas sp. 4G]